MSNDGISVSTPTTLEFSSRGGKKGFGLKYIPPRTSGNRSEFYVLPTLDVVLMDLRKAAGNWRRFLEEHVQEEGQREIVLAQILELLEQDAAKKAEYEGIRRASEQAQLVLMEDELLRLSDAKGKEGLTALKWLLEKRLPHKYGRSTETSAMEDPLDRHLKDAAEDG